MSKRTYKLRRDAAAKILWRAIAAEVCTKAASEPFYRRVQVVRVIMRLLIAQKIVLFGKKM